MSYETKTVIELRAIAKERGLTGYSKLKKADLIDLINNADEPCHQENTPDLDTKELQEHSNQTIFIKKESSLVGTELFEKMNRHQKRRYLKLSRKR